MDHDYSQDEIVELVRTLQAERLHLRCLLERVSNTLLDHTPDGITVAYLDRRLLSEIQRTVATPA